MLSEENLEISIPAEPPIFHAYKYKVLFNFEFLIIDSFLSLVYHHGTMNTTAIHTICLNEDYLFEDRFLSKEVQSSLPDGYKLNPLRSNDFERGYLDILSVLTEVGNHTRESWDTQFNFMRKHNDTCK